MLNIYTSRTTVGGFRPLTANEVELVSGGIETGIIYVTGTRLKVSINGSGGGFVGYADQGYDGTDNPTLQPNSDGSDTTMEPPKETPCVSKSPDGVELTDINTAALVASNMIASKNDEEVE